MKPTGISPSFSRHLGPLLVLLLHQAHLLVANVLTTGSTPLRPPNYITCSSGEYAFGFRALEADPSRFFLGVWFNINLTQEANPAEQKVVWYAKDPGSDSAVNVMALSVLDIIDGYLSLGDTSGIIIWKNPNPGMLYGADLVLQDSGNLQFLASRDKTVVWESFRDPTDTLLPGQSMGPGSALHSKHSDTDLSRGRFGLYVQDDNNIVFYLMNLAAGSLALDQYNAYWASNTVTNQTQDGNTTLFFDSPGHLYYQTKNGMVHDEIPPLLNSTISYHQHATLDPDGIVRLYTRPKNATGGRNMSWAVMGQFPTEGCKRGTKLQGLCGINSFCVYGPNDRLDCECPSGYSYVNSQLRYMGCTQGFMPQSCDGKNHSAEFGVVKHPNTNWAKSPYERRLHITEDECASYCLNDCLCAAATYDGTYCSKMVSLAGVGRRGGDVAMDTLIKVRTSSPSVPSSPRRILPYVLLGGSAFLLLSAVSSLMLHWYLRTKNTNHDFVRAYTAKELYQATNGFHRLLGRGGFGEVYYGMLKSLHYPEIAVKKLISSNDYSEREFANEVQSIGQIHHRNLVRMVGYCKDRAQRMLVFEFMPGGSLRSFLFQPQRPMWCWRAEAALGIAKGLEYLHEGCNYPIIHCDIKPDNILLDNKKNPKITDFGIARLLSDQQMHTTVTNVRGTRGYIAPEWFQSDRRIDTKVDVYSFGVVLLEMICCRKSQEPVPGQDGDDSVMLFEWAGQLVGDGRTEVLFHSDDDAIEDLVRVERFLCVALWCIEQNPSLRPTMHQVVQMLEGVVEVDTLPAPTSSNCSSPLTSSVDESPLLSGGATLAIE